MSTSRRRRLVAAAFCALGLMLVGSSGARGQTADSDAPKPRIYRTTGARIAVGRSIAVHRDEEVRDAVVVVGGSVRVDGRVRDGIVVVGGNVELGPEAQVDGDVVLLGGTLTRADGARLYGGVSDLTFGDWPRWSVGLRFWPWIELSDAARWIGLAAAVLRVSVLAVLMGIVLLALAITIVGIPIVLLLLPLTFVASLVALLLGFTALACRVGEWIEDRLGWRLHSALAATALGLLVIVGPTLLSRALGVAPEPLRWAALGLLILGVAVEFLVWTMGLGATLMTSFGRRATTPPAIQAL
ncbi:MAG: hypothetical protein LC791_02920 [Acidobacteria bacterium]|nr:hypothetical protein [Acidobacteriota bacterium]